MTKTCLTRSRKMFLAALGLTAVVPTASHAQAPPLGTTANFAVLSYAGITNTGNTIISGTAALPGDIGSATATITGFSTSLPPGPGLVTPPGVHHTIGDAPTMTALNSLGIAYANLAARTPTANLSGVDLGGLTLIPGVYNFSSSAQLTGTLNLNALGNPNAIFIFNIGSALTTASASAVTLLNGAQGGNVFWRVGSSATLGTTTSFAGDILAQASITLNTGSRITCGAAWAQTGAVTLDTNTITMCDLIGSGIGPVGAPLIASLLLPSATANQRAVASAIDAFAGNGGLLPLAFINLFNLSAGDLGNAVAQLSGESGTGIAQAGTQAMNSFLSLVTNPFADNRALPPVNPPSRPPLYAKAPFYKAAAAPVADPRRWSVWGAAYGGQTTTSGDALNGSHDRSARSYGFATGLDYRVSPYTVAGFALAGGNTNYGLSDGLGGGSSDMFQAAVYSLTRVGAAYVSAALAYGWHQVSTDRVVTVAGLDRLTAGFAANSVGGRIEGGYRFAIPGVYAFPGFGFTPYAAFQMQAFRTPSYSEIAVSGSSMFALDYQAHTTTTTRTELGAWVDRSLLLYPGAMLSLRGRAAWAHDNWSDTSMTAGFQSLPGSIFTVIGATPVKDSLLVSAVAEVSFRNGISVAGKFDTEQAAHSQTYVGTARLRYAW
ncbi:MAG: ice-binding family protein [Bradyrhizobium sp.]|uniref:ice-binding family protein n=1 Tax=Bradyrhizobium sp. TaxID=376 RepID=UPI002730A99D|nr:ice-binding family protein [Bradyrhizobium sp.]MDP1865185.1 ice-binding family protein [Bradyrhizobium sp.]